MGTTRIGMRRLAAALVVLCIVATSCSTAGPPGSEEDAFSVPLPQIPPTARERLQDEVRQATDRGGVALTLATLPNSPPRGYSRSAVTAIATQALALIERASAPQLSSMSRSQSFRYVLGGPVRSFRDLGRRLGADVSKRDWPAFYADRFDQAPSDPTHLVARWSVRTIPVEFDDGTSARVLEVELQTVVRYDQAETAPLVVMRTVTLSDFGEPATGRSYRSISVGYAPLFSDWCVFTNGAVLRPAHTTANLRRDLRLYRSVMNRAEQGRSIDDVIGTDNKAALARCETPSRG